MIALRLDILVTPMDSTTVTTAASPSGIAATARETATMKELSTSSKSRLPAFSSCTPKTTAQIPKTNHVSTLESWFNLICKGVSPASVFCSASAILPISVSMPTAVTTATPLP